jgi:phospholipase A-2-activating protein
MSINDKFIVIDLSRLLLGFFPEAFSGEGCKDRFADALFRAAEWNTSWAPPLPKPRETNMLLLLRTMCNGFQEDAQTDPVWLTKVCFPSAISNQNDVAERSIFLSNKKVLETLTQAPYTALNKTQRVALATIVFNVSCQGLRFPLGSSLRDRALSLINKVRRCSFHLLPRRRMYIYFLL